MRNPERIDEFCMELARIWHKVPDWRFSQLISNVYGTAKRDPFFMEEDETLQMFYDFFKE